MQSRKVPSTRQNKKLPDSAYIVKIRLLVITSKWVGKISISDLIVTEYS